MIEYIEYKGKKHPLRISYIAMKQVQKETKNQMGDDITTYESLLYFSMKRGYEIEQEEMPFKRNEMPEILDECFLAFLPLAKDFFQRLAAASGVMPPLETKSK